MTQWSNVFWNYYVFFAKSIILVPFQLDLLILLFFKCDLLLCYYELAFWGRSDDSIMYTSNVINLYSDSENIQAMMWVLERTFYCISRRRHFSPWHYLILNSPDGFNKLVSIYSVSSRLYNIRCICVQRQIRFDFYFNFNV